MWKESDLMLVADPYELRYDGRFFSEYCLFIAMIVGPSILGKMAASGYSNSGKRVINID